MATDSTHLLPSDTSVDTDTDMSASGTDLGSVQLAAATGDAPIPVNIPRGQQVIVVPVKPGQTIELPTDSVNGLLAKLGADGNLAIVVDGRTIILQGYAEANAESPIKIVTNDGDLVDVAEVIVATNPEIAIDIQTAAGPAAAGAQGGTDGAAGSGIFVPFAAGPLLGGFDAAGVLGATQLQYKNIDDTRIIFVVDKEGNNLPQGIIIVPDEGQPVAKDGAFLLDEDFLKDGNQDLPAPSPQDDDGSAFASGTVVVDFGLDGPRAVDPIVMNDLVGGNGTPSGLFTTNGTPILLHLDAPAGGSQVLHGYLTTPGVDDAFVLVLDTHTGHFEIFLIESLLHDENSFEDNVALAVDFSAFDSNGDGQTATLNLNFDDDMPEIVLADAAIKLTVDESVGGSKSDFDDPNFPNDGIQDGPYLEDDEVFIGGALPQVLKDIDPVIGASIANASVLFDVDFGADNGALKDSELYSLTILNSATGLVDTETQQPITLIDNAGVIEGRNTDGDVVFALTIDLVTGVVSMAQYRAIDHGDEEAAPGAFDEVLFLGSGHLAVTLTATDGDGDKVSANADIGNSISFEDDAPEFKFVDFGKDGDITVVDKTIVGAIDEDDLPSGIGDKALGDDIGGTLVDGVVNFDFGSDLPGSLSVDGLTVTDQLGNVINLADLKTSDGRAIEIDKSVDGATGVITWEAVVAVGETGAGDPVFTFTLDGSGANIGDFKFELHQALEHPFTDPDLQNDGPETAYEDNLLFDFTVIGADGDGDEATGHIKINVDDESPTIHLLDAAIKLAVDETVGGSGDAPGGGTREENDEELETLPQSLKDIGTVIGAATADAETLFSVDFGADGGPAADDQDFSLKILDKSSGLFDTETGHQIILVEDNGMILGVVDDGDDKTVDPVAFALTIDSDGDIAMAQYRAVDHGDEEAFPGEHDEVISLGAQKLAVVLTATDADGDSVTAQRDIGGGITFDDDGPVFVGVDFDNGEEDGDASAGVGIIDEDALPDGIGDAAAGDDAGGTLVDGVINFDFGSDQPGALSLAFLDYTITDSAGNPINPLGLKTVDGQSLILIQSVSPGETILRAVVAGGPDAGDPVFTFKLDTEGDGIGTFSFELFRALEHPYTDDDFNNDGKDTNGDSQTAYEDNLLFDFRIVGTDGDGDEAVGHITIDVDDDSPVVTAASGSFALAVDETVAPNGTGDVDDPDYNGPLLDGTREEDDETLETLPVSLTGIGTVIGAATADASVLFSVDFGADGGANSGSKAYGLTILDANTGLKDTQTGQFITLVDVGGGVIEGQIAGGVEVFALSVDPVTGLVSMAQYRAVDHGDEEGEGGAFDEVLSLGADKLAVTLTATDADGDKDSESVDIGGSITFEDDGPTFDETDFDQEDGDFSGSIGIIDEDALKDGNPGGPGDDAGGLQTDGIIKFDFGSDKAGGLSIDSLTVKDSAGNTIALADLHTSDGRDITINKSAPDGNGVVTWSAVVAIGEAGAGDPVFTFKLDTEGASIGAFSFTLQQALEHPFTDPDFLNNGPETEYEDNLLFDFTVIGEDGDGDEATGHIQISVDDDSPDVGHATSGTIDLTVDETVSASKADFDDPNFPNGGLQDGSRAEGDEHLVTLPAALTAAAYGPVIGAAAADASGLFTVNFGADGGVPADDQDFSLTILDATTDLIDTATGDFITLFDNNGVLEGRNDDGDVVFALTIDDDGNISMAQYRAVDHGDEEQAPGAHDEVVALGSGHLAVTLSATDNDGDKDSESVDIGGFVKFEDDAPSVEVDSENEATVILATQDAETDGVPTSEDKAVSTANFSGVFAAGSGAFGSDGPGSVSDLSYALGFLPGFIEGSVSGLTIGAVAIRLYESGGVITGSTALTEGTIDAGNTVFTVSVSGTGVVTLTQFQQVDHPTPETQPNYDDDQVFLANNLIGLTATATITDKDGDSASGSETIDLGGNLRFDDDGPFVDVVKGNEAAVILATQDAETDGVPTSEDKAVSTANFTNVFSIGSQAFGADGPGTAPTLGYTLGFMPGFLEGGASGLTIGGQTIFLYENGGVITGSTAGSEGAVDATNTVFTVAVSGTGVVTLTQLQQIDHPIPETEPAYDDDQVFLANGKIGLTATATITDKDGDSDTDSETIDLGGNLRFDDDGPSIDVVKTTVPEPVLATQDAETDGNPTNEDKAVSAANFAGIFSIGSSSFGADGPGTVSNLDYALGFMPGFLEGSASGLTIGGQTIFLYESGGVIIGSTAAPEGTVNAGNTVFTVSVDANGVVTLTQFQQIDHDVPEGAPAYDDDQKFLADGKIGLTATATITDKDGDSDTDSQTVDLGGNLRFDDDGPFVDVVKGSDAAVILATQDAQTDGDPTTEDKAVSTANFSGVFSIGSQAFGADGPGTAPSLSYSLGFIGGFVEGGASGLTIGSQAIFLYENGGVITGSTSPLENAISPANTVFTVSVDGNGVVTLTQFQQVDHPTPETEPTYDDDQVFLANGKIGLTATATITDKDGDSDTDSETVDLGGNLRFDDDGPFVDVVKGDETAVILATQDAETDGVPTSEDKAVSTANFSGAFSIGSQAFGADGPGTAPTLGYTLGFLPGFVEGSASGLKIGGQDIFLYESGGVITGSTAATEGTINAGNTVFTVSVSGTGVVTLTQLQQIDHPIPETAPTYDDDQVFLANGKIGLTATATITDKDGDSDTDSETIDLGGNLRFDDDGPTGGTTTATTLDEEGLTGGIDGGAGDLPGANLVTTNGILTGAYGADGPGQFSFASLHGTQTTLGTETVNLSWNGASNTLTGTGPRGELFTIQITNLTTGAYVFTLKDNVLHATGGTENEATLTLGYTITDKDSDSIAATFKITIDDDSPVNYDPQNQSLLNFAGGSISGDLDLTGNTGIDGFGSVVFTGFANGDAAKDTGGDTLTSDGKTIELNGVGTTTLTGYVDANNNNIVDVGEAVFTATLDPTTDSYQFNLIKDIDDGSAVTKLSFDDVEGGQEEWFFFDSNEGAAANQDVLVTSKLQANQTANTSATDIGNSNQFIDDGGKDPNEGLRIDFALNVGGTPDLNTGLNAENGFIFTDHFLVNNAGFTVAQTQGNGTTGIKIRLSDTINNAKTGAGTYADFLAQNNIAVIGIVVTDGLGFVLDQGVDYFVSGPDADGYMTITGLDDLYKVTLTGAASYDRIEVDYDSGAPFAINGIFYEEATAGTPLDLQFQTKLTDADGDTSTGAIDMNLQPADNSADTFTGHVGNDVLFGGGGNDTVNGGDGNDTLNGGGGNDTINGGNGNDVIVGGQGNDTIDVSQGNDIVKITTNLDGNDVVNGFDADSTGGQDTIDLDTLFDSLGVASGARVARVQVSDGGADALITVDLTGNGFGAGDIQIKLSSVADHTTITVGTGATDDVQVGTL